MCTGRVSFLSRTVPCAVIKPNFSAEAYPVLQFRRRHIVIHHTNAISICDSTVENSPRKSVSIQRLHIHASRSYNDGKQYAILDTHFILLLNASELNTIMAKLEIRTF